jgi:Protein of unknown function (DUF1648)
MRASYAPLLVLILLSALLVGETAYYLPLLPERLATHFDISGRANGWSRQSTFTRMLAVQLAVFWILFIGAGLIGRIPDRWINLPNKAYWLAPERREASLAFLRDWTRWFLAATLAFLTFVEGLALRANFRAPPEFPGRPFLLFLLAFAITFVAMMVMLFRRFRRT